MVWLRAYLGAIAELVRGQVDFPKAAFANQLAQRVVADTLEVRRREFTGAVSIPCMRMRLYGQTYSRSCLYELASWVTVSTLHSSPRAHMHPHTPQRTFFLWACCSAVALGFMRSATCAWSRACFRRHLTPPWFGRLACAASW